MFSKKILIILLVVIIIAFIVFVLAGGYWAVAFVNKAPVSHREFNDWYGAALNFYQNNLKMAGKDPKVLDSDDARKELKRAVLESLVESKLIEEELKNRIGQSVLNMMVQEKIDKTDINNENLKKGAEVLYGLSTEKLKEIILVPKAEEEILEGRLFAENKNLDNWLKEKKAQSTVIITLPGFFWENGEVKTK